MTRLAFLLFLCPVSWSFHAPTGFRQSLPLKRTLVFAVAESSVGGTAPVPSIMSKMEQKDALDIALRSNSTGASLLLLQISDLREAGDQEETETFLNGLVDMVEEPWLPWWSRFPFLARTSRRARLASLKRTLILSTPTADENGNGNDGSDWSLRRKRRALVVLLRAIAEEEGNIETQGKKKSRVPTIRRLEKAARVNTRSSSKIENMATRIPQGLETPNYSVVTVRPTYEVRKYDPFSVCSVSMSKPRPDNRSETDAKLSNTNAMGASAFGALAGYLFGKNKQSTAMKMTTPVLSAGAGDNRQMSFILPSDYWASVDRAPKPLDNSGVVLKEESGGERAVVMFGGFAGKQNVEKRTTQLLAGLEKDKEWAVADDAEVTLAQYNDPFTPPWQRLNEVSIAVVPRG